MKKLMITLAISSAALMAGQASNAPANGSVTQPSAQTKVKKHSKGKKHNAAPNATASDAPSTPAKK